MPLTSRFMRWCLFLSRVAFICNLFFLGSVLLQWKPFVANPALLSTIIITGYFLAPFVFSPAVAIYYAFILMRRKRLVDFVPRWLVLANFVFLLLQCLFVLFFLHDSVHT